MNIPSYYISKNGQVSGPFSIVAIIELNERKMIDRATLFCLEGTREWISFEELEKTPEYNLPEFNKSTLQHFLEIVFWLVVIGGVFWFLSALNSCREDDEQDSIEREYNREYERIHRESGY